MDQWSNGQRSDMSVTGQFQNNNAGAYDQPQGGSNAGGYGQPQSGDYPGGYGQPQSGGYAGGYGQPQGGGYGQPQNNYDGAYGGYGMPPYQKPEYAHTELEEPVGVGEWIGLLAIASFVPFIGLILVLVWALNGQGKKSKSNFCKAYLLIELIKLVLFAVLIIVGMSLSAAM